MKVQPPHDTFTQKHVKRVRVYSRLFVQQRQSLLGYFEFLGQPPLQPLDGLFGGDGQLEACAGSGMDVQIHGGFTRDGLAGRSPSAGAAAGAGVLVHSIACTGRGGRG